MTEDPRSELTALLAQDGPAVALRALRCALRWSARELAEVIGSTAADRDAAAVEAVVALDDALAEVDAIADGLTRLTEVAVTGTPVAEHLERQVETLIVLADRAAVARREQAALAVIEQELRVSAAEHDRVSAELDELRRYERLAAALPELKTERDALAVRLAAMRAPVDEAEQALLDTATQVLTLSTERLDDLNARTAAVLGDLADSERAWAAEAAIHKEKQAELERTVERYEQLRVLHAERVTGLREYIRIDAELMASLPGGEGGLPDGAGLRRALENAERTLAVVDDSLRAALEQHERRLAVNRRLIDWDEPVAL